MQAAKTLETHQTGATGVTGAPLAESYWLLPMASLWRREVVRFVRQRSRVVGALGTPLVFWVVIGSGFGKSFVLGQPGASDDSGSTMGYLEYFFPGSIVLIVLFTAIFSTISIIEDRREGFLQAVLAAPVRRSSIVLGKVLGSTTLALGQALLFLLLAPLAGIPLTIGTLLGVAGVLVLVAIGLSGLGFLIAWPMDSMQGFHAVMNLLLMPMWLLSGAAFPASGASSWVGVAMAFNPVTYHVAAVRHVLYWGSDRFTGNLPPFWLALLITVMFAGLTIALSARAMIRSKR